MFPYTPLHYLLLACGFTAIVMTSGNLSEEPIAIDNEDAFDRLSGIADYFLVHDRDIYLRSDDSLLSGIWYFSIPLRMPKLAGAWCLEKQGPGHILVNAG